MLMCASGSQNLMYLSQSLSTLLKRQGFIIEPRAGWPGNTSNPPVCPLLWAYRCTVTPGSLLGYRDPNSDPHACTVNTCPLSHLPNFPTPGLSFQGLKITGLLCAMFSMSFPIDTLSQAFNCS